MKKILISTGGSGGHVIPAMCLYDHLKDKFDVILVSDKRGSKFIDNNLYSFKLIDVPNIKNSILKLPINFFLILISIIKSFKLISNNKVDILISTGGYMSLPLCFAAKFLKINILLFEPNMVLGRSNKFMLKYAKKIICYQKKIINLPKIYEEKIYTIDHLLRKEIYNLNNNLDRKKLEPLNILVLGGSQATLFFDKMIKELIIDISKNIKINLFQQIYDDKKKEDLKKIYKELSIDYKIFHYNNKLYENLNIFDIAITRSGASALAELVFFKIPFIAIPFPYAKDNHQFYNAKFYSDKNCCWIVEQNDSCLNNVANIIKKIIKNKGDYDIKKENLSKISYQNTWNNINKKLINLINEN